MLVRLTGIQTLLDLVNNLATVPESPRTVGNLPERKDKRKEEKEKVVSVELALPSFLPSEASLYARESEPRGWIDRR